MIELLRDRSKDSNRLIINNQNKKKKNLNKMKPVLPIGDQKISYSRVENYIRKSIEQVKPKTFTFDERR